MLLSPYPTTGERIRIALLWLWCGMVILFLLVPILIPVPL
ncbi:MAG: ABC transporter permease, partial [Mesorhizobium sp.]